MNKNRIKDYIYVLFGEIAFGSLFAFFMVTFQRTTSLRTIMDGVMISGVTIGMIGCIMYLSNVGLFEVIEYVFKFLYSVITRREFDVSYFEMVTLREKMDFIIHRTLFFTAFLFLSVGSVLYYMYYNT